jgi:hypothetical protein
LDAGGQRGIVGFFKAHPILLLLVLTPGIPEYLSGSSALNILIKNPLIFFIFLAANLGLYGPGVLLIREAKIRWHKGWATVLLLGAAYGILEEGIALSTLFNPAASPVGQLGFYGHWLGVNWIWTAGILSVHMIFSISLPILLLGLALPETNGQSLLSSRAAINATFAILSVDVLVLFLVTRLGEHFWMGTPVFLGSFAAIGVLVFLAPKVPANVLTPMSLAPTRSPFWTGVAGALFYPSILFVEFFGMGEKLPAPIDLCLVVLDQFLYLMLVLSIVGRSNNERHLTAFAAGLIIPIGLFGVISEIPFALSLLADLIAVLLLRMLWKKYPKKTSQVVQTSGDYLLQ